MLICNDKISSLLELKKAVLPRSRKGIDKILHPKHTKPLGILHHLLKVNFLAKVPLTINRTTYASF